MALDPDAQLVIDMIRVAGRPPFEQLTPAEARATYAASRAVLQPEPDEVAEVRDLAAPGTDGDIPLRLYRPGLDRPLPGLVYFHGGGWLLGGLDTHDVICRRLANLVGCVVVSVDYRLAPENKFPAAVDDSAAAVRWAITGAETLGIDPTRVAVGGDSAGGNLAAVMALMARDSDLPPIAFQVLVYPATDMMMTTLSSQTVRDGLPLTSDSMRWFIDHYLRDARDRTDMRASPLRAADLAGTAPALVLTATHDPLRDEGTHYARRLERDGVRVVHLHFSDQIHGYLSMGRIIRAAEMSLQMIASVLKVGLSLTPAPVAGGGRGQESSAR